LPDGIFAYQKYQLGYIFEDLGMKNVGVPNLRHFQVVIDQLIISMAIWYILPSDYFYGHLVYFAK
jgi:hypothetical protein